MGLRRLCVACTAILGVQVLPTSAYALRPFDSTDPAVADFQSVELELSPISYQRDVDGRTWIAPHVRINYGVAPEWEVVLEGQRDRPQDSTSTLTEDDVSFKHVLRDGSLEDKEGLSIATEVEVLLPGVRESPGTGASVALIVGQKWEWGSLYFNTAANLTRDHHAELFFGQIWEGPERWRVRPVAEVIYQREFSRHREMAGLVGGLYQATEHLVFDLGLHQGRIDDHAETELRLGFTLDFHT
jgi:hypothetical protein